MNHHKAFDLLASGSMNELYFFAVLFEKDELAEMLKENGAVLPFDYFNRSDPYSGLNLFSEKLEELDQEDFDYVITRYADLCTSLPLPQTSNTGLSYSDYIDLLKVKGMDVLSDPQYQIIPSALTKLKRTLSLRIPDYILDRLIENAPQPLLSLSEKRVVFSQPKKKILREILADENKDAFISLIKNDFISAKKDRDEIRTLLQDDHRTEELAAFLEWEHQKFDREKEEDDALKRQMADLLAKPDSAKVLRKIWATQSFVTWFADYDPSGRYNRLEDFETWGKEMLNSDLSMDVIRGVKEGKSSLAMTVPGKIGKAQVIGIDSRDVTWYGYRPDLRALKIPEGIVFITALFDQTYRSQRIQVLILPKSLKYYFLQKSCIPADGVLVIPSQDCQIQGAFRNRDIKKLVVVKDSKTDERLSAEQNDNKKHGYWYSYNPEIERLTPDEMESRMQELCDSYAQIAAAEESEAS